jgi:hypothetical protein
VATTDLVERAHAALDDAFAERIKGHFGHFVGDVAGDGMRDLTADEARFRNGLIQLKTAYGAYRALIGEVFGGGA